MSKVVELQRGSSLLYHFKDDVGQVCIRHERGKARVVDAHHFRFRQQDQARCRTQATQRDSFCNNISSWWIFLYLFTYPLEEKGERKWLSSVSGMAPVPKYVLHMFMFIYMYSRT